MNTRYFSTTVSLIIAVIFCCSGLAFVANRNLSPQVALFCWQANEKNEAAMVEILNDAWTLSIDFQGAG